MTRFVLRRLGAHWLLLAAALLSVLLSTAVLATLAAFSGAVGDAGLRRSLQDRPDARSLIEVKADADGLDRRKLDAGVRKAAARAFGGLPVRVSGTVRSGPYALPKALRPEGAPRAAAADADADADTNLTLLATFDPKRAQLVDGRRPGPPTANGDAVPVAVPEAAAKALRLHAGQELKLTDRRRGPTLRVRITGVYRPDDRAAPYWRLDPLRGRGVVTSGFTTYGPLLADERAFALRKAAGAAQDDSAQVSAAVLAWQASADFSTLTTDRTDALSHAVEQGLKRLAHPTAGSTATADSDLPELLTSVQRTLQVSKSTLLLGTVQLALVALSAILLVAGLLARDRSGETALLRARGASRGRLLRIAGIEALLLAAPAAVLGPLLAAPLVELLAGRGALARAGVTFDGQSAAAWWTGAATALICGCALAAPALRRPSPYAGGHHTTRAPRLPAPVRAGADVGLTVLAGLAYWQLQSRSSDAADDASAGTFGIDPVLVAAPALCLLAGTVVAMRLLPLAARLGEGPAAGTRGLPAALTAWQLSRRPGSGTGPALLLVLAVAMGVFALGDTTSSARSQRDQADFSVGADLRVTGSSTPPFGQAGLFRHRTGVSAFTPAHRTDISLPEDKQATLLAMDAAAVPKVLRLRRDLAERPLTALARTLRERGPGKGVGAHLPDGTRELRFDVRLEVLGADGPDAGSKSSGKPIGQPGRKPSRSTDQLTAIVQDRYGARYAVPLGEVQADGRQRELTADLSEQLGRARDAAPAGPLRLVDIQAAYVLPKRLEQHRLSITSLQAVAADGSSRKVAVPDASRWAAEARADDPDFPTKDGYGTKAVRAKPPTSAAGGLLQVRYRTGQQQIENAWDEPTPATLTLHSRTAAAATPAGIATDGFLRAAGAKVGGSVRVTVSGIDLTVRITGAVRSLPTTGEGRNALLLDLRSVNLALSDRGVPSLLPGEWWLAAGPGAADSQTADSRAADPQTATRVAAALRARSDIDAVQVRAEERRNLAADPLGAGPQAALPAAALAAMLLAAAGFAVSAVGTLRERAGEFAVLRAMGTSRGRLTRAVAAEQGLLVLVAVGAGAALGWLLARMAVPLVVLNSHAAHPEPKVLVDIPTGPLLLLIAAAAVVPLLVVVATALRPDNPARTLRREGGD